MKKGTIMSLSKIKESFPLHLNVWHNHFRELDADLQTGEVRFIDIRYGYLLTWTFAHACANFVVLDIYSLGDKLVWLLVMFLINEMIPLCLYRASREETG